MEDFYRRDTVSKLKRFIENKFALSDTLSGEVALILYTMKECGEDLQDFFKLMQPCEASVQGLVEVRQNQGRYVSRSVRAPWCLAPKSKAARPKPY